MILILCCFELNQLLPAEICMVTINVFSFNPFGLMAVTGNLLVEVLYQILFEMMMSYFYST